MSPLAHLGLMARYNQWMNAKLLELMAAHPHADFHANTGAFFGSVWGTLNHLIVADLLWMGRLSGHKTGTALSAAKALPQPTGLNDALYSELGAFAPVRRELDALWLSYIEGLSDADFDTPLTYRRVNGDAHTKPLGLVLSHVFNHQTHHRGQITTLLSQMGLDIGVTDVLVLVPELDPDLK
ncbi:DinB family protein [Asticcacaulis sp.]|uniref:DinB family protein n=1 Tax=Asticcacaulis sp. TaxID=1872648 RepID=UPI002620E57A|nr:DinB family protein [Asticcacaulis sp.]